MVGAVIEKLDELSVKLLVGGASAEETLRALAAIVQAAQEPAARSRRMPL
jgi:hypothetical protein